MNVVFVTTGVAFTDRAYGRLFFPVQGWLRPAIP